jgi:DNA replication protein DnaC
MTLDAPPLAQLPPMPRGIRMLLPVESQALDIRVPGAALPGCPTCKGSLPIKRRPEDRTFLWHTGDGEPRRFQCPCYDQYQMARYFYHSGVPTNYQRLGWGDFEHLNDGAASAVAEYLTHSEALVDAGFGLCIYGPRGNGKSLVGYLTIKEMLAKGYDCYCTTFADMIEGFMDTWREPEQKRWFNQTVRNAGILFIDDIGREHKPTTMNQGKVDTRPGAVRETMLEAVIRQRVANCQPTIITTNLTPDDVANGYGGHTMSLLTEKTTFVEVTGSDRRREIEVREKRFVLAGMKRPVVVS